MLHRNRKGSNQHARRSRGNWKLHLFLYAMFVIMFINVAQYYKNEGHTKAYADMPIISPLALEQNIIEKTPNQINIDKLVKEVFGKYSDKANKVLDCENHSRNPNAVNTAGNEPKGSRDIGIFQINEYWQKTQAKFLFDPEINVRAAWIIFRDNGYTFDRWTCGRKLGI